jgi:outer membrane protein assembly complex protein YaeT
LLKVFQGAALCVFLLAASSAQAEDFWGKTVTSIAFGKPQQTSDQKALPPVIDPHDLADALLVAIGRPLDRLQLAASIDRLYATGLYDDVQVDAEPSGDGVALRFLTVARRFIGHVDARGKIKDPPNRNVIIGDAQLVLGQPFDADTVETARKNIEREMRTNGLFKGQVSATTIEDPATHQMTIGFVVDAGKRAKYDAPVISGDTKLPNETIIAATGWRIRFIHRWRQVTQSLSDKGVDGVQKKYAKKDRLTASVDLTSIDYDPATNRAQPHLNIDAGPKIAIHALEAKVSKGKLLQMVPIYEEGSVDNDLLTEGARNLTDYFQGKGYPDVDVTFRREPVKDDQEVINYYIAAGPRRRLVDVKIDGNNYFLDETLRERMFLQSKSIVLRYGRYSESFRSKDEESIANLYQSNGFRNVKVTSTVENNYKGKERDLAVTFHVSPGPQWRVSKLSVEGPNQLDISSLRKDYTSIEGQPFAEVNIASDRNRILQYYYSNGFLSASFRYQLIPDNEAATVQLIYYVNEGPREFVRKVLITGLDITRPSLISKDIDLHDDDPLSMTKINEISRKLSSLGVFASVNSAIQDPDGRSSYKYVVYDFDEANRYTFNVGFGLEVGQFGGTTSNFSEAGGSKGVSPIVSFDVNRVNFLGLGQTISLQTKYSSLEQRESLNYIVPRFLGSTNRTVTFSILYDTTQDVQTFSSHRQEVSVQTSQRFNRASTLLVRFAYRRVTTGNVNIPALLVPQLSQAVRIGILSASYIQDHRDNPSDAHRGFWNTIDTGVAGGFFGSQRSFMRVLARNATYTSIGRNLVFARQTQFGAILPFSIAPGTIQQDEIPLPERFFGGGGVSMRGFGDNQAGPRDIGTLTETGVPSTTATGFPIGGNALFFNTFELRFPLLGPNISGVVFHDMGNIYNRLGDISFAFKQPSNSNFNYAVQAPGFGIRYKTPLGPVRVDFSYALNPTEYQGFSSSLTTQQLLNCGAANSCPVGPQKLNHFNFFFSIGQAF